MSPEEGIQYEGEAVGQQAEEGGPGFVYEEYVPTGPAGGGFIAVFLSMGG